MSDRRKILETLAATGAIEAIETTCAYSDDGRHCWQDITALSDTDNVEICSNCNRERRWPRDEPR